MPDLCTILRTLPRLITISAYAQIAPVAPGRTRYASCGGPYGIPRTSEAARTSTPCSARYKRPQNRPCRVPEAYTVTVFLRPDNRSGLSCFLLRFAAGITPALRYFVPPCHDVCFRTHRARAPLSDSLRSALRFVFRSPWARTPTSPAPTTCSTPSSASILGGGIRVRDSVPPSRNRLLTLSFRATHSRSDSLPVVAR